MFESLDRSPPLFSSLIAVGKGRRHSVNREARRMWSSAQGVKKKGGDDDEDLDVRIPSFTDADLDDPELLAELQGLAAEVSPVKASIKKQVKISAVKTKQAPVADDEDEDIDAVLLNVANLDLGDVQHAEFTDHDMNDPELLVSLIFDNKYLQLM
jgi:hypothetical protein